LKDGIEEKNFEIENLNRQIRLKNEELKSEVKIILQRQITVKTN